MKSINLNQAYNIKNTELYIKIRAGEKLNCAFAFPFDFSKNIPFAVFDYRNNEADWQFSYISYISYS